MVIIRIIRFSTEMSKLIEHNLYLVSCGAHLLNNDSLAWSFYILWSITLLDYYVVELLFLVMWLDIYIVHTDPTNFLSAPNPLRFRSESVIISIRPRIRNRSLSDPIRIREKKYGKGYGRGKIRSDPIRLHPYTQT